MHPDAHLVKETPILKPDEFIKRTYVSNEMKNVMLLVMGGLAQSSYVYLDERGRRIPVSKRVMVIPSALGGGKTHLLAALYYLVKLCNEVGETVGGFFEDRELIYGIKRTCSVVKERGGARVVVIAGDTHALAPTPDNPVELNGVRVHTPWGLLSHLLGEYEKVRRADEEHYSPGVDELEKVLRGKAVLILVDEAVEYLVKAVRLDSKYPGYSESFLSFIRNLAVAVDETPGCVLVVTLPVEFREGRVEKSYQHPEYVERVNSMLSRVTPEYHPPLAFERDVCEVFKKRLFENTYGSEVRENVTALISAVDSKVARDPTLRESIKERYGDALYYTSRLRETYPFAPVFLDILVNVALKTPELGLTRYLISFVSRLIKYVYERKARFGRDPNLALVTPWAVPIDETEFRFQLLRGMLSQIQSDFQRIYEQDVKRHSVELEQSIFSDRKAEPQVFLNGVIARSVWLTTIPGRGGKGGDVLKLYPRVKELPVVVYDPIAMGDLLLADVINALKHLESSSTYLSVTQDERVLYAIVPDILAILRQKHLSSTDFDALRMLELLVNRTSFKQGRHVKHVPPPIYSSREEEIERFVETNVKVSNDPTLVVYLGLETPPSGISSYVLKRNNVVLLLPDLTSTPTDLGLRYTERVRRILGPEPPSVRDYVKNLLKLLKTVEDLRNEREYLREAVGEDNLDYVHKVLGDLKREVEKQLFIAIYSILRKAVVGTAGLEYDVDLRPFDEEVRDLSTLCRQLEDSLRRFGVITEWSWSDIVNQLKEWTSVWDIDYSPKKPIKVGEIWYQLLHSRNVKPHLTRLEDLERALENAYVGNVIAFKRGDVIVWLKHPYSRDEAEKLLRERVRLNRRLHDWERDVLKEIERMNAKLLDLEIISPRLVVREYVKKLMEKAETRFGEKTVRRLLVLTPDGEREFETFVALFRDERELVDALSKYPVVLVEEKPSRGFELSAVNVCGRPLIRGEALELEDVGEIDVKGYVDSDERFEVKVMLEIRDTEDRQVSKTLEKTVKTPGDFELKAGINQPGEYNVFLRVWEPSGFRQTLHLARVRVRGEKCVEHHRTPSELKSLIEASGPDLKVEVECVEISGRASKGVVQSLSDLLVELSRHGARVSGSIRAVAKGVKDAEVKVGFEKISSDLASKVVRLLGSEVGDVEVDLKLLEVSVNALKASRTVFDVHQPLHSITRFKVKECRRI